MDDNNIKSLFQEFDPELSSDMLFLARLEKSMEAIEIVKHHNDNLRRHNRIAVIAAAIAGIVTGAVLTLLFPMLCSWFSSFTITTPQPKHFSFNFIIQTIGWLIIGGACVAIALNTYEILLSRLTPKAPLSNEC